MASGNPVTFSSSNPAVATVSGNTVTIVGGGTVTINAYQAGTTTYLAAGASQTFTINKAAQTITFGALAAKTFGDASFTLTSTASSGLAVTYTSSNPAVATVSGSSVTIVGAGTTTITASQPGNANYLAATDVPQALTVNKQTQTITFSVLAAKTYGDAAFNLSATGGTSGNPISFVSSNTAVATVSGNTATIVGAGTTTITASQAGNANYNAAADVPQTLTVNKQNQVITFGALLAKTFGDIPFTVSATGGTSGNAITFSSSNTSVATVSGNVVTIISAGTTNIIASQAGNANYNAAADVPQTLVVNKAAQAISFSALTTRTMGDAPFVLTATGGASGNPVTFVSSNTSVATVLGNVVTIVGAGTTTITASQASNLNYNAASDVTQNLPVIKGNQTITFGTLSTKTFGDVAFGMAATASSGLPVSYVSSNTSVATVSGNMVTIVGAGSTTITASQAGDASFNGATSVPQTLTVNKANQSITFGVIPVKALGDASFTLSAASTSGLGVSYASSNTSVATVSGNTVSIVGAGTATITASQTGNTNYNAATDVQQTLVVNGTAPTKTDQTITFNTLADKLVEDAAFNLTGTSTSGLTVAYASSNTAVATVSGNTVTIVGSGVTIITASQAGNSTFNVAVPVPRTLTVNKANQTITFSAPADKNIGDANFNLTATASSSLAVSYSSSNTSVATVSGSTVTIVGLGTTIITASQTGNGSYNGATPVSQTLTVNKTNQTITFNTLADKTVGDANFNLTATASSSLAVSYTSSNTSVATVSGNIVTIVGGGTTIITASQVGNTTYSAATDVPQSLTVNKGNQTITFGVLSSKTFGDTPFTLTGTASSGLAVSYVSSNTSVATVLGSTVVIVGAGSTTITASHAGNTNYNAATSVPQTLTVNKANQVITFSPLPDKAVGDAPFNLTATASSGLPVTYLNGTASVATLSGNTVTIVGVGTTSFLARQSGNSNYNAATPVAQGLNVIRIPQSISNFTSLPSKNVGDPPFELTATASSGLPVTYVSSNTAVATISGSTLTIVGGGSATINAMQGGNDIYAPSTTWALPLIVNRLDQAISFSTLPTKTVGDVPFNLTATASSGLPVTYSSNNPAVATVSGNMVTIVGAGTATITATQAGNTSYNLATPVARLLTVNKLNQAIAFSDLASKTVGDAEFDLTATANSGLPVSFTSSNPSVATVAGSTVTIVGGGSTIITALQPGNATTYNAAVSVTQMLTVNKSNQAITFGSLADKTLGDANFNLSATASSGLTVTYASSDTDVASVSGNTVTIVGAGTSIITAMQAGNGNFNAATPVTQTLTINKTNQSITFTALSDKNVGDAAFNLTAIASSGLAVAYTSSNTSVATVSGNTVTIVGAGTTIITATQAGNTNFSAAPEVSQPLTVNAGSQAISFGALSTKTYGDDSFVLTATASSGLPIIYVSSNTSVATISGSMVSIIGAGSTTITASQSGSASYNAATPVQQTLTVNKANQTIIFNALPDQTIDAGVLILEAIGGASGNPVTFSSSDPYTADNIGNMLIPLIGGTVTITASQAGNANYNAATDVQQLLTIHKADQEIAFPPLDDRKVGDEPFLLDAASTSGWELTLTSSDPSVATISGLWVIIVGPGTTTITASQDGSNRYNPAADVQQTLTVNKGDQMITFNPLPAKLTTDVPFNLTASVNSGLPVSYISSNTNVATISGSTVTIVGAGTTTITASQAGNTNYNAAVSVPQDLRIIGNTAKTDQSISFNALADKNVGDAAFNLTATATSSLPVNYTSSNTAVATVSGNTLTIVGGGSTFITASQSGNGTYNAATPVLQLLTVNKLNQTITFSALADKNMGDANFNLTATASSSLAVSYSSSNTGVATVSASTVTIVGIGTTIITASQTGNTNYNAASPQSQTLTVSKTDQTITFNVLPNKFAGDDDFILTATASSDLSVNYTSSNTSVATVSGSTIKITGPGTTVITAYQPGDASYNSAKPVSQPLTVTASKTDQTISFAALTHKTLGDDNFNLTASASSGLAVSYTSSDPSVAAISGGVVTIVGTGTTIITASQPGNASYNAATPVAQVLQVKKLSQIIVFEVRTDREPGEVPFDLSATASSGLTVNYTSSNPSVATISGSTVTIVGVGTTIITASQPGDASYGAATDVVRALTVTSTKADQTIAFSSLSDKIVGDAAFDLTATASSGLEVSYESSNQSVATISGSTVTITGSGTTMITALQSGNGTYTAAVPVSQTLTVNKKDQFISFSALTDKTVGDAVFSLTATASSGLAVNYSSISDKVVLTGASVNVVKPGRTTIIASQIGDSDHKEATPVSQSFCIRPVKPTITVSNPDTESPILTSSATEGNQWFFNDVAITGATNISFHATQPGVYKVQVTVDDCVSDFSVEQPLIITGMVENIDNNMKIEVYPNPASDWLYVSLGSLPGKKDITIFQLNGVETASQELDGAEARFQVADYPRGMYVVKVKSENRVQLIRFVKH